MTTVVRSQILNRVGGGVVVVVEVVVVVAECGGEGLEIGDPEVGDTRRSKICLGGGWKNHRTRQTRDILLEEKRCMPFLTYTYLEALEVICSLTCDGWDVFDRVKKRTIFSRYSYAVSKRNLHQTKAGRIRA